MSQPPTYRILAIDDNPSIHEDYRKVLVGDACEHSIELDAAESILFGESQGSKSEIFTASRGRFEIDSAESGERGLEMMIQAMQRQQPYSVAFVDMRMPPGWNGVETTKRLWQVDPDLPIVFCTAYTDYSWEEMVDELDRSEQFLVLKKPFDNVELRQLAYFQSEKKRLTKLAALKREELEKMVEKRTQEIKKTRDLVFFSLARLAESRDNCTGQHLERIEALTWMLGKWLANHGPYQDQIDEGFAKQISESSVLHDIGKVGIPDNILLKPGRLTPDEFEVMKTHVNIGAEALDQAKRLSDCCEFLSMAADIARYHHERFDGSGYPHGLSGMDIPLSARIVALADVFDALTTKRVYKDAMDPLEAKELIISESGRHFDPVVVDAFVGCWEGFEKMARANQAMTTIGHELVLVEK